MDRMNTVKVRACAKLNLTLDITGRADGYHALDSIVTTIDLADRVIVRKRRDKLVNVLMHGMGSESIPPERNNAQLAAEAFVSAFSTTGADVTVYKNIPLGAGLGGSSADAAGVLRALSALYGVDDRAAVKAIADSLGSDTGYLLTGGFARLRGRGERAEALGELPEQHFLLLCPPSGVSAGECYRKYDELGEDCAARTERFLAEYRAGGAAWAAKLFGNALTRAACALNPQTERALEAARSFSPLGAGMTGSGSAAFALFPSRELCEWAKSRYRGKFRAYCVRSVNDQERKNRLRNPFALSEEERGLT